MFTNESTCVNQIFVNPLTRSANVEFKDGGIYNYEGISLKGLRKWLLRSEATSVGQWINQYLKTPKVSYEFVGYSDN